MIANNQLKTHEFCISQDDNLYIQENYLIFNLILDI